MNCFFHRGAERDLGEAFLFYQREGGNALAARFIDELERAIDLLQRNPELGKRVASDRRTFPLTVFPYSIIYRRIGDDVRILVVRHQHRSPDFGARRS